MNTQTRKKLAARNCTQHPERSRLSGNSYHRPGLGSCGRRTPGWGASTVPHNKLPASVRGCVGVCETALAPLFRTEGRPAGGEGRARLPLRGKSAFASRWTRVGPPRRATRSGQQAGGEASPCTAAGGLGAGQGGGHCRAGGSAAPAPRPAVSPRPAPQAAPLGPFPRRSRCLPRGAARFPQPSLRRGEAGADEPGTHQTGSLKGATEGEVPFICLRRGPGLSRNRTPVQGLRCCPFRQAQPCVCRAHGRPESPGRPSHFAQPFSSVLGNTYFVHTQIHASCHLSFFHLHSAMYHARVIALEDSQKISLSEGNDFSMKLLSVCMKAEFRRCTFWRT